MARLTTNTLLGIQVTVLAEMIGMLKRADVDVAQIMGAVPTTPVRSPVAQRLSASMMAGNFTLQFPIELIEKDFSYTAQAAGSPFATPIVAAARRFSEGDGARTGKEQHAGVVQLYTDQKIRNDSPDQ
jgi:3-hydroxyisobutyrate dehydrogenase